MTDPNLPSQTCAQIELICWPYLETERTEIEKCQVFAQQDCMAAARHAPAHGALARGMRQES